MSYDVRTSKNVVRCFFFYHDLGVLVLRRPLSLAHARGRCRPLHSEIASTPRKMRPLALASAGLPCWRFTGVLARISWSQMLYLLLQSG